MKVSYNSFGRINYFH